MRSILLAGVVLVLAGCASQGRSVIDTTAASTIDPRAMQAQSASVESEHYLIGPTDVLKISVFQVPDLSFDELRVDSSGNIQMPLIGTVRAADMTPGQLSETLRSQLGARYLQNPQVSVSVVESASQKVTIDGDVTKPGVYEMRGRTTLIQAVAMAEGPTRTADLSSVAVFRNVDGQRLVAVFDLRAIRNGEMQDPVILGDDIVVVDRSRLNAAMREVLAAVPAFAIFRPY
ncbi:MAG: polysaccharide biosynthesis/export family protein [Pseudomonadota bacterium]